MEIIEKLLKEIPLKDRFRITTEMTTIKLLTDLGFIDNKQWDESDKVEMELLNKIIEFSKEQADYLIEEVEKWEGDGRP